MQDLDLEGRVVAFLFDSLGPILQNFFTASDACVIYGKIFAVWYGALPAYVSLRFDR